MYDFNHRSFPNLLVMKIVLSFPNLLVIKIVFSYVLCDKIMSMVNFTVTMQFSK